MVALFVILTILVCVGIDGIVQLRKAKKERVSLNLADQLVPAEAFAKLSAPANLFLDDGHTWVEVKPSGAATIGLDGFAQKLIGRIDDVMLPEVGKEVNRGDMLFAVKQDNHRAAFASPVDGVVMSVDKELPWHPEMIQSDPYKDGWVCSLMPRNLAKNLKQLRHRRRSQRLVEERSPTIPGILRGPTARRYAIGPGVTGRRSTNRWCA